MKTQLASKETLIERAGFREHFQADSWEDYNRMFFNGLAEKYDFLNEILTFGRQNAYKSKAVKTSGISDGDLVIDIATGSGDMAMLMARMFRRSHIVGVDVADNMLNVARQRAKRYDNVEFQYGDAVRLPFDDGAFDSSMMSFGLRNFSDIKAGIKEMRRVTKSGGAMTILDLGKPRGVVKRFVYKLYFETLLPFLGKHVFHRGEFNSFRYLPESNKDFPEPHELVKIFNECGLSQVRVTEHMMGVVCQYNTRA